MASCNPILEDSGAFVVHHQKYKGFQLDTHSNTIWATNRWVLRIFNSYETITYSVHVEHRHNLVLDGVTGYESECLSSNIRRIYSTRA